MPADRGILYNIKMEFRLSAMKYLLTWPQSPALNKETIMHHLKLIERVKYVVVGQEEHQDGNAHFHAAVFYEIQLNRRRNVFSIGDNVCNVRVIGNRKEDTTNAIEYVKKCGDFIWEGVEPQLAKKLKQTEKVRYAIEHSMEDCIESGAFTISELVKIPVLKGQAKRPRNINRRVLWFYGITGSGKTMEAVRLMMEKYNEEYWMSAGDLKTFKNGYNGEEGVILDDLRCSDIKFNDLLRLCDRYKYSVNVKGTVIPWLARDIIITSPYHPCETFVKLNRNTNNWECREDIEQLIRRIKIFEFPRPDDSTMIIL